jgi:transcriptional regulator with XRE-family HTH domain
VPDPALGHQLRALRTAAGRTVASVAADAGLSVPYIANLENGRGNPTITALSQLASALGMRLVITLDPVGAGSPNAPDAAAEIPASLVRLGRTRRFQRAAKVMAQTLERDSGDFSVHLVNALATVASLLSSDPSEADWWRLVDALLLMTALSETGHGLTARQDPTAGQ